MLLEIHAPLVFRLPRIILPLDVTRLSFFSPPFILLASSKCNPNTRGAEQCAARRPIFSKRMSTVTYHQENNAANH